MTGNVFEEDPFGGTFPDDAGDLGPEVTGIVGTTALSGTAEGLAGIPCKDHVESAAEAPGIECSQIIPDWRRGEIPSALGRDENGSGICLPFDKCAGVKPGFGKHDAQIKASAASAEGQSMPGT